MTSHHRGDDQRVVRVRMRAHAYSSPVLSPAAASKLRDELVAAIRIQSPEHGFVLFLDRRDREVSLRARDIYAVEVGTPYDDELGRPRPAAAATVPGLTINAPAGLPAASGTDYLRGLGAQPVGARR